MAKNIFEVEYPNGEVKKYNINEFYWLNDSEMEHKHFNIVIDTKNNVGYEYDEKGDKTTLKVY